MHSTEVVAEKNEKRQKIWKEQNQERLLAHSKIKNFEEERRKHGHWAWRGQKGPVAVSEATDGSSEEKIEFTINSKITEGTVTLASSFDEVVGEQKKLLSSGLAKQIKTELWTDGTWGNVDGRGQDLSCLNEKKAYWQK